ncbi:MAG: hypothetical protein IK093_10905, partial [Ruminiclostridium sp.]|nr:hypothetical protein [Ruminiclostridium sp.]
GMGGMNGMGGQQSGISVTAGSQIVIKDASGNVVYSVTAEKSADSILYASDDLTSGTYTLYVNGQSVATATVSTGNGSTGGMGGGMGAPGMGGMNGNMGEMNGNAPAGMPTGNAQNGNMGGMNGMPTGNAQNGNMGGMNGMPTGNAQTAVNTQSNTQSNAQSNAQSYTQSNTQETAQIYEASRRYRNSTRYTDSATRATVSGSGVFYSDEVLTDAEKAAAALEKYLKENNGKATFTRIEDIFSEAGFDYTGRNFVTVADRTAVWYGWSDEAVEILDRLIAGGKVKLTVDSESSGNVSRQLSGAMSKSLQKMTWVYAFIELC